MASPLQAIIRKPSFLKKAMNFEHAVLSMITPKQYAPNFNTKTKLFEESAEF